MAVVSMLRGVRLLLQGARPPPCCKVHPHNEVRQVHTFAVVLRTWLASRLAAASAHMARCTNAKSATTSRACIKAEGGQVAGVKLQCPLEKRC